MRIMYVLPTQAFGGAERQALLHIKRLPECGIDVLPIVGPGKPMCRALEAAGVKDYVFLDEIPEQTHSRMSIWGNMRYCVQYFSSARRASNRITALGRAENIDLVFGARTIGWIVSAPVARNLRVPLIVRQGSRPFHPIAKLGARLSPMLLRNRPTAMLSNCEAAHRIVAPLVGVPGRILPNAVDVQRFDSTRVAPHFRETLGLSPDVPVVGVAARPAPDKGFEFLGQVALKMRQQVPNMRMLIAGDYGWRAHFEQHYKELGLGDTVVFLGHVDDVETFYASCDLVVLASRERSIEASPNAVLEAMAMQKPIVSTNVGGVPEAITHGVEGYLVAPDDLDGFVQHAVSLLGDRAMRLQMGEAGRDRILRQFGEEKVIQTLADTLNEIVADPKAFRGDFTSLVS